MYKVILILYDLKKYDSCIKIYESDDSNKMINLMKIFNDMETERQLRERRGCTSIYSICNERDILLTDLIGECDDIDWLTNEVNNCFDGIVHSNVLFDTVECVESWTPNLYKTNRELLENIG